MQVLADSESLATWLEQRRERGLDRYDYMDHGRYVVVAPAPGGVHARAVAKLLAFLSARDTEAIEVFAEVNIGVPDDYRVPDACVMSTTPEVWERVFHPTARLVAEVLSPGEQSKAKLDHYESFGVGEYLEVDPADRLARLLRHTSSGWESVPASQDGWTVAELEAALFGPPRG